MPLIQLRYNLEELKAEFEGLTGQNSGDVLKLTGRTDFDSLVVLTHFAIAHANLVGAPKGQVLTAEANNTTVSTNSKTATCTSSKASGSSASSTYTTSLTSGILVIAFSLLFFVYLNVSMYG